MRKKESVPGEKSTEILRQMRKVAGRKKHLGQQRAEEDFLASVMVSVSAALEAMSEAMRTRAVAAAERAVAHLQ